MLKTSILAIGDEILIGQIVNTNSQRIAEIVTAVGCKVVKISTIGDEHTNIIKELDDLLNISDLLIITGGLGPTHDDITKQVLCDYVGDTLVESAEWLQKLIKQFEHRNIPLVPCNREQALIPSRSQLLFNRIGTAPGMLIEHKGKHIISTPGVPQETIAIMNEVALPIISEFAKNSKSEAVIYKNFRTSGVPESVLADMLAEVDLKFLDKSSMAYLPNFAGVKLRIGAYGSTYAEAEKEMERISSKVIQLVGKHIICEGEESFASVLGKLLKSSNKTLAVAESCTGGLLGGEITSVAGSSAFFLGGMLTYSNEIKIHNLGVKPETINKFGAVSRECAEEMAARVREKFRADYGISITGIAGPDGGTDEKPVGTVWIGIADSNGVTAEMKNCGNAREMVRDRTIQTAIVMLINKLRLSLNKGK